MAADTSIIIANLDSPLINLTLKSLYRQSCLDRILEILVVGLDNWRLVSENELTRLIDTGKRVNAAVARNIGICQSGGTYIAFIDSDCIADRDWLARLLDAQETHEVVGGSVSFPIRPYWQLCYNVSMFHEFLSTTSSGMRRNLGTLNLCVRRDVIKHIGLMDERLDRGQDTEWTLRMRRLGYNLYFESRAKVLHLPQVHSFKQLIAIWYRSGKFNGWVRWQYRDLIAPLPFGGNSCLLYLFSPAIGLGATLRIFKSPRTWRYLHTFPVVFASKVAWCWGATRSRSLFL
jgi:GT2 family glycosyltransferase